MKSDMILKENEIEFWLIELLIIVRGENYFGL